MPLVTCTHCFLFLEAVKRMNRRNKKSAERSKTGVGAGVN